MTINGGKPMTKETKIELCKIVARMELNK